jgi:hypothetical protein
MRTGAGLSGHNTKCVCCGKAGCGSLRTKPPILPQAPDCSCIFLSQEPPTSEHQHQPLSNPIPNTPDDFLLATYFDSQSPAGNETSYRTTLSDLNAHMTWQQDLKTRLPDGSDFRYVRAFVRMCVWAGNEWARVHEQGVGSLGPKQLVKAALANWRH